MAGILPATWVPAYMAWIAKSVPEQERAEEMGRLGAFRGLWGFPAPYIGGLLYDAFGIHLPILINMLGAAVVVVMLWLFVREPEMADPDVPVTASP